MTKLFEMAEKQADSGLEEIVKRKVISFEDKKALDIGDYYALTQIFGERPELEKKRIVIEDARVVGLDLSDYKLGVLPEALFELEGLIVLNLNYNGLGELPKEIGKLSKLRELYLYKNKIKYFPEEFWGLENLEKLDLKGNGIRELPKGIGHLKKLVELDLSHNKYLNLPEEFWGLENLEKLDLSFNELGELPREIGNLRKLRELYLWGNKIKYLPWSIRKLRNLTYLNLRDNHIGRLHRLLLRIMLPLSCRILVR